MVKVELVEFEEIMAGGQVETENTLKPFITEKTVMCNEKHPLAFIAFSNFEKCINRSEGDRRWYVVNSKATPVAEAAMQTAR